LCQPQELAEWFTHADAEFSARIEEVRMDTLGTVVHDTVRSGGACALQLETRDELRWAFVSGTEVEGDEPNGSVRALLLVHPNACAPWAAGYNARIDLQGTYPRDAPHGTARYCRGVEGGLWIVRPRALLLVEPSGLELALRAPDQL